MVASCLPTHSASGPRLLRPDRLDDERGQDRLPDGGEAEPTEQDNCPDQERRDSPELDAHDSSDERHRERRHR